ncbi:gluconate 2-dehydrogenase subunit 3 family protein [Larkinella rosea]|uniref:Gluconate 2-dehydrogenase subunit 3 family protein n=1 Tax=Larkinella rosea TaxID=2025312 RepID=A0A3P1C1R1_9BACT|nr:gluconate 2-dehydrogenase subunit 3 family protein [Larkinella rosea]RRB07237.1 gluconate 2-dehydrogenase subunit 3 family protein [Larkinella rosea]
MSTSFIPRREALQRLALLVGTTLSLPVQAALRGETSAGVPLVFAADQQKMIADLAEVILPATDTPGAKAAGVDRFIEYVIGHCTVPAQQETFQKGLQQTDAFSRTAYGKAFSELDPTQQTEIVRQLTQREKQFFQNIRELTIVGFFTSELGATKVAEYLPIPGRFQGDIPLKPGQKVWAI